MIDLFQNTDQLSKKAIIANENGNNKLSCQIEMPVKKLMFLQNKTAKMLEPSDYEFLLYLGGPEQNASVLDLINKNKWDNNKDGSYMGIYENAFDKIIHSFRYHSDQDPDIYLVGCEVFIHGFSKKKQDRGSPCAELNKILLGDKNQYTTYNVMGYSAMMTVIGAYAFFRDYHLLHVPAEKVRLKEDYCSHLYAKSVLVEDDTGEPLDWRSYFDKYEISNNLNRLDSFLDKYFNDKENFFFLSFKHEISKTPN